MGTLSTTARIKYYIEETLLFTIQTLDVEMLEKPFKLPQDRLTYIGSKLETSSFQEDVLGVSSRKNGISRTHLYYRCPVTL